MSWKLNKPGLLKPIILIPRWYWRGRPLDQQLSQTAEFFKFSYTNSSAKNETICVGFLKNSWHCLFKQWVKVGYRQTVMKSFVQPCNNPIAPVSWGGADPKRQHCIFGNNFFYTSCLTIIWWNIFWITISTPNTILKKNTQKLILRDKCIRSNFVLQSPKIALSEMTHFGVPLNRT